MYKVLIVDDSLIARKMMMKVLMNTEYKIHIEAKSGEEAVIQYLKNKPDIITMDYDMPGIGGLQAARRIIEINKEAKIVFVTAHSIIDFNKEEMVHFSNQVVQKPVTKEKLLPLMNSILSKSTNKTIIKSEEKEDLEIQQNKGIFKEYDIEVGQYVIISHYSNKELSINSIISKIKEDSLELKITKDFVINNYFESDPVVIGFETKKRIYICEGEIKSININNKIFEVKINALDDVENQRQSQRFPVSIYVEVRHEKYKGSLKAVVKDISVEGMNIITNFEFEKGDKINLEWFLDNEVLTIESEIMWKKQLKQDKFNYGIKNIYKFTGDNKKRVITNFISELKDNLEKEIQKLRD